MKKGNKKVHVTSTPFSRRMDLARKNYWKTALWVAGFVVFIVGFGTHWIISIIGLVMIYYGFKRGMKNHKKHAKEKNDLVE